MVCGESFAKSREDVTSSALLAFSTLRLRPMGSQWRSRYCDRESDTQHLARAGQFTSRRTCALLRGGAFWAFSRYILVGSSKLSV